MASGCQTESSEFYYSKGKIWKATNIFIELIKLEKCAMHDKLHGFGLNII